MANRNGQFLPKGVEDPGTATNARPSGPSSGSEAPHNAPALPADDERMIDEALIRVQDLIAEEVNGITDDDVSLRLRQVLDQVDDWWDDDLALYGYRIVGVWINLAMAFGHRDIRLAADDVDEIVTDTVARATTSFCAGRTPDCAPASRAAFLGYCAENIPRAYRSWRLRAGALPVDDVEELERATEVGQELVELLRRALVGPEPPAAAVLRSWGHTDHEIEETLTVTKEVLATFT